MINCGPTIYIDPISPPHNQPFSRWTYIPNTIRHKNRRGRETLLRRPRHIRHADTNDQTDHRPEEADDGVTGHGSRGAAVPRAAPDNGAPGDDGEAAGDEEGDADVRDAGGEVAGQENEDEDDAAKGELEEDGFEGGVAVVIQGLVE